MKKKICCIFNLAPLYNAPIYKLMDQRLECDFYIGDTVGYQIKLMNYKELNGFVKTLKYKQLWSKFYWQRGAVRIAFKAYDDFIMNGEPYCISSWLILIIARLKKKKVYLWTHGWYGNESLLKGLIKKIFFNLSTKVLLYGDYARDLMIEQGIRSEKLVCIYNSLDYENQIKIRESLRLSKIYISKFNNNLPVVIYIGRIQKSKKVDLLVELVKHLQESNILCNLVVIGKEVDNSNIKKLVNKCGLNDYVWLYGECYNEQVIGELLFNSSVCIVPGNIGLTIMHSLVYGTPVITHDNFSNHGPEFEAILPGLTGDFYIENSIEDLVIKSKYWITLNEDERIFTRQNCYKVIQDKYNPQKQIDTLMKVLNIQKLY